MRIVAGTARGRRIEAPDGGDVRPTTDRVREATFNALWSMGALDEVTAIDLFAGSGALGLEALSRGATHVTFVDFDRRAVALVRRNLEALGFGDRARIVTGEALGHVRNAGPVDLALCDPPYAFEAWNELLGILDARVVVIESDRAIEPPAPWRVDRCKRYGGTFVTIVSRTPTVHPE